MKMSLSTLGDSGGQSEAWHAAVYMGHKELYMTEQLNNNNYHYYLPFSMGRLPQAACTDPANLPGVFISFPEVADEAPCIICILSSSQPLGDQQYWVKMALCPGTWGSGLAWPCIYQSQLHPTCVLALSRHCIKWPQIWFELKFQMPGKPNGPWESLSTQSMMTSLRGLPRRGRSGFHIYTCFMTNSEPCIYFILVYP